MTFSIKTFNIIAFSLLTLGIMTFSIATLGIMAFNMMTLVKTNNGFNCETPYNENQHSNTRC